MVLQFHFIFFFLLSLFRLLSSCACQREAELFVKYSVLYWHLNDEVFAVRSVNIITENKYVKWLFSLVRLHLVAPAMLLKYGLLNWRLKSVYRDILLNNYSRRSYLVITYSTQQFNVFLILCKRLMKTYLFQNVWWVNLKRKNDHLMEWIHRKEQICEVE